MQLLPRTIADLGLRARLAWLTGALLALLIVVAPVAYFLGHWPGVIAATGACGLCLAGALVALFLSHWLQGPQKALYGLLAGMAARMGIPLVCGLVINLYGGALAQAGFVYYLLVFYPVTLAVEIILSLPIMVGQEDGSDALQNLMT